MQTFIENYALKQEKKANRRSHVLWVVFVIAVAALISMTCLYFQRVNDSRLLINCESFTSQEAAQQYGDAHPGALYQSKKTGQVCTTINYKFL